MSFSSRKPFPLLSRDEVGVWLTGEGLGDLKDLFKEHSIDGECLPHLTEALLIEMGVADEDVRAKFANAVKFEVGRTALSKDLKRPAAAAAAAADQQQPKQPQTQTQKQQTKQMAGGARIAALYNAETSSTASTGSEAMESLYSFADRYGFIDEDAAQTGAVHEQKRTASDELELENQRSLKWAKMVTATTTKYDHISADPKFRKRVYKGIPNPFRLKVWLLMTLGSSDELDAGKTRVYQAMLDKPTSEVDENQIDLDINRTLRNHIVYRQRYGPGQQRLFNVLRAYANYDTEVGFCQGMASVAAFLLIYCKEETTFFIMEKLVSHPTFRLRGLWISGFPMLMEGFYVHDRMLKYHLPRLYKHFKKHNIHPSSYATRWYMTIFLGFPFHTCLRIWDVFLLHGFDVLFFIAMAVLEMVQGDLLSLDFEGMMEFLGQMSKHDIDDDKLIRGVFRIAKTTYNGMPGRSDALQRLRADYQKSLR